MATFHAGKLGRKKNGCFQSTEVKSKTKTFLDSRKTKSRVIALMMLKCHFSPRVKVKPHHREFGLLSVFSKTRLVTYLFFGIILFSYSSSLCHKKILKNFRQQKKFQGKKYSLPSLVDTKLSPRDHTPQEYL